MHAEVSYVSIDGGNIYHVRPTWWQGQDWGESYSLVRYHHGWSTIIMAVRSLAITIKQFKMSVLHCKSQMYRVPHNRHRHIVAV